MKLLKYMKSYRRDGVLAVLCVAFETLFELVIPLIMAQIIDTGVTNRDYRVILFDGVLMIVCALCSLGLGLAYAYFGARFSNLSGYSIREALFQKIQSFSFSNIDHFSTSSLITRLTSDVNVIQNCINTGLRPLVRAPVMLVCAVVLSFMLNAQLAVVFLIAVPILAGLLYLIIVNVRPLYTRLQKAVDWVNLIVQENLTAIRVVKAYVREDYEKDKFAKVNHEMTSTAGRAFRLATLNMPAMQLVMYTTVIAILWFGGNLIHGGSMQVGQLTGFLSYILQVLNSLMMISNVFMLLTRAMTSITRIEEVIVETNSMVDDDGVAGNLLESGDIKFEHVYFKYKESAEAYVLEDINLTIASGQTVGIIGTTGSGKSTLASLILRLYDIDGGEIQVGGRRLREYSMVHLRDAVAIVLQKNLLFSGTIRSNLLWGNPLASDAQLMAACDTADATEFISAKKEKLDSKVEQAGANFSGGQKQRLCIARALLKEPRILILDDSTSALDRATETNILNKLETTLPNTTKLIIAQKISSVMNADQIIIMDDGKINAIGTHDELLVHNEIYQDIYHSQQEGVL